MAADVAGYSHLMRIRPGLGTDRDCVLAAVYEPIRTDANCAVTAICCRQRRIAEPGFAVQSVKLKCCKARLTLCRRIDSFGIIGRVVVF